MPSPFIPLPPYPVGFFKSLDNVSPSQERKHYQGGVQSCRKSPAPWSRKPWYSRWGFCPFPCSTTNFPIDDSAATGLWEAWMARESGGWNCPPGVVAYGKLFSMKVELVDQEWYPNLANYQRNGYDFDSRYEVRLASYREKCIMDVLLRCTFAILWAIGNDCLLLHTILC